MAARAARAGAGGIDNGYHYNMRCSAVPPRAADGQTFGSRGAGVPYLAGLVRPCELRRGASTTRSRSPTPSRRDAVYPATKSDGARRRAADMPEGTRLQLDPLRAQDSALRLPRRRA